MRMTSLLTAVLLASGAISTSMVNASAPAATPVTNPEGEKYLDDVQKAVANQTHRELLSKFTEAGKVPVGAGVMHATVCIQKLASGGIYRSHSNNPDARGIVTNQGDLAAFGPLFQLLPKQKFLLNVSANLDGTGDISTYIGVIVGKDGDGSAAADTVCFARYLQIAPVAAPTAPAATPAPAAS